MKKFFDTLKDVAAYRGYETENWKITVHIYLIYDVWEMSAQVDFRENERTWLIMARGNTCEQAYKMLCRRAADFAKERDEWYDYQWEKDRV